MGWNDWNSFGCNVSDTLLRQTADRLVSTGMAAAGYRYVNIDDCWSTKDRDGAGNLVADPAKFPAGMKSLADYVPWRTSGDIAAPTAPSPARSPVSAWTRPARHRRRHAAPALELQRPAQPAVEDGLAVPV